MRSISGNFVVSIRRSFLFLCVRYFIVALPMPSIKLFYIHMQSFHVSDILPERFPDIYGPRCFLKVWVDLYLSVQVLS